MSVNKVIVIGNLGAPVMSGRFQGKQTILRWAEQLERFRISDSNTASAHLPMNKGRQVYIEGFSTPYAAIRGCASITNAFGPRANLARSLSSRRCESC